MTSQPTPSLGLWTGVGLVVANMIGAGVFLSTGFMAQNLGPAAILLAWVVGAALALAGARAYAAVAELIPRSGGEYRFLSDLLHPAFGYLAGWASLLLGFSAPIALDALAAASYLAMIVPGLPVRPTGAFLVGALVVFHAAGLRSAKRAQNALVGVKALLILGFVTLGLVLGHNHWPDWAPPQRAPGLGWQAFVGSLFYIAYAFSGWNAAVYAADEFRSPRRDVPRAMLIGCSAVAVVYLLLNWIFVANLAPAQASAVFGYDTTRVTLGHLIATDLLGRAGATAMSALIVVAFISAMSAMTLAGPRVYAAMARDGFLPRILCARSGRPPSASVVLQGAIAIVILYTHEIRQVLQNVGAVLVLFSGLTACTLFRVRFGRSDRAKPSAKVLLAAGIYAASALIMLYVGFRDSARMLLWITGVAAVALGAYGLTRFLHGRPIAPPIGENTCDAMETGGPPSVSP